MSANRTYKALDASTTVAPGPWIPLADFVDPPSIQFEGFVALDIVQVEGSNDEGVKEAIVNVDQLGSDVTADGLFDFDPQARTKWVRANRTDITGAGTINARLSGTIHGG